MATPSTQRPKGRPGSGIGRRVPLKNPKNGTVPKAASKPKKKPMGIGFNPQKMAKTMTDLGYGSSIAEIQREIERSNAAEAEALKDLQGWANQIEEQRATGAAQTTAAWDQAKNENRASDANINALFGGVAGGEAGAYAGAGQDMLSALAASGASFDARMAPILGAQSLDYRRRAQGEFAGQRKDLQGQLADTQREKGQAYQKNLLDLMDMAWGRKQDILQYQTGQQALKQAAALQDYEIQAAQQGIVKGKQDIQQGNLNIRAQKLALKKSNIELQKLANNPNGINWNDPATRSNIGNAAFSGAMSPRNTFAISPKIALNNAMTALAQMGLAGDPRAVAAVRNAFVQLLRLSHAHNQWRTWSLNKKGQLIHDPTKSKAYKKAIASGHVPGKMGPPAP